MIETGFVKTNQAKNLRWSQGEVVIIVKSFKSSEEGEIYLTGGGQIKGHIKDP